jgi:hypothetical protein
MVNEADQVKSVKKVQPVHKVQPVKTVKTVSQVVQVLQVDQVAEAQKVHKVHEVQKVKMVSMAVKVHKVHLLLHTVSSSLDTPKKSLSQLAQLVPPNFGMVTPFSLPKPTNELTVKILALLVLVHECLAQCHSCSAT